jgi:hypothetical protein
VQINFLSTHPFILLRFSQVQAMPKRQRSLYLFDPLLFASWWSSTSNRWGTQVYHVGSHTEAWTWIFKLNALTTSSPHLWLITIYRLHYNGNGPADPSQLSIFSSCSSYCVSLSRSCTELHCRICALIQAYYCRWLFHKIWLHIFSNPVYLLQELLPLAGVVLPLLIF